MQSSSSIFDRFTSPRILSPILPLHSPRREVSEYQLDELDPRPDDAPAYEELSRPRQRKPIPSASPRQESPASWQDRGSSVGSSSKRKPRPMFAGPPAPITSSMMITNSSSPSSSNRRVAEGPSRGFVDQSRFNLGSLLLPQAPERAPRNPDSLWRGLRRQEKALEEEIQELLDFQAAGLIAGLEGAPPSENDTDAYSDTGSSTPTGTFYSTATSKSRMLNSLYVPAKSNPDGNVIPVRQPNKRRPRGLRSSRAGLRRTMSAMVDLKREEDAHIDGALSQRKQALVQIGRLEKRRVGICSQLEVLEGDEEEPLGKELRGLGEQHDSLDQEIHLLEEKLVGMRNRRRWLREKMSDVKNKKDAGLSGYRGALKSVDLEVKTLMQRPTIQPLDPEMVERDDSSPGGDEFLKLIPERRTIEMAKTWWEGEIAVLERRKSQIDADRQALEEGGGVWKQVMTLVTEFESGLRQVLNGGGPPPSDVKGKGVVRSSEDLIHDHLLKMDGVVTELEQHMQTAEEKHWNLLICAIGAELEAFKEAQNMLRSLVMPSEDGDAAHEKFLTNHDQDSPAVTGRRDGYHQEESDNEVPPDLLVSHTEDTDHDDSSVQGKTGEATQQSESEDEVPPEFLAEHDHHDED